MALTSGTIYAVQASATTGNVNAAGFNPAGLHFPTDLAATSGTTSSPSVTSATYTFLSTDINAWIYIQGGSNWLPGWYQITGVTAGAATLSAAIGAAITSIGATGIVTYSTVAGCVNGSYVASTASGVYSVDYSQLDTAPICAGITTGTQTANSTTFTDSTASKFTPVMVGNLIHLTAVTGTGASTGWYEIIQYTDASDIVLDRTATNGSNNITAATYYVGGAGRLNGLEDAMQASIPAGAILFVKNGSYTLSGAISTANASPTAASPAFWIGYNANRGDVCNGSNRPVIAAAANAVTYGSSQFQQNISFTTTTAAGIAATKFFNCKIFNSSTTASRVAATTQYVTGCECISQNGNAVSSNSSIWAIGNYYHDSAIAINMGSTNIIYSIGNLIESCTTGGSQPQGTGSIYINTTFYGREAKIGYGLNIKSAQQMILANNIFYGFVNAVEVATAFYNSNYEQNNNYYNNTTDVSNWTKDASDLALNPSFSSVSQVTGTAGQGLAGSKFQDTSQNFATAGVVANRDFLHITSGGSLTAGCYLITAITTTTNTNDTLTLNNSAGTGAASAVYWITVGHNFKVTNSALWAQGFPSFTTTTNSLTTGYPTPGAVVPQTTQTPITIGSTSIV